MSDGAYKEKVSTMTLTERLTKPDPRHLPDNVVPLERVERRSLPRWRERMDAQGLPPKDMTGRAA